MRREPCGQAPTGRQWFPLTFRDPNERWDGVTWPRPVLEAFPRCRTRAPQAAALGAGAGRLQPGHHDGAACRAAPRRGAGGDRRLFRHASCCRTSAEPEAVAGEIKSRPPVLLIHGDAGRSHSGAGAVPERAGAGGAGSAGGMAYVGRRRPRHRPGGPAPRRRVPRPPIRPAARDRPATIRLTAKPLSSASQSCHAPCRLCSVAAARHWACRRSLALNVHVPGNGFPALVLNADFRPLSYYPLSLWSWQDAIKAVFLERVNIVEEYDQRGAQPEPRDEAAERGLAQDLREAFDPSGLHAVQRVPARPLLLPVLRLARRSHLRPSAAALARRPHHLDQRGRRLLALQSAQGQHDAAGGQMWPSQMPFQPRCSTCTATAGCSRRTTCTRAGSIISTGIPSSIREPCA